MGRGFVRELRRLVRGNSQSGKPERPDQLDREGHPGNIVKDRRDGVHGEHSELVAIRRSIGELPAHIKLLPADTGISTLSLFSLIDACVTVRGTAGIEAACFGVPVLTAGTGRYDRLGFTRDASTKEEYLSRLAALPDLPAMSEQEIEKARRFAYGMLLCRPASLGSVRMEYQNDAVAGLKAEIMVPSQAEFLMAPDIRKIAEWINSDREDYFLPSDSSKTTVSYHSLDWTESLVRKFWNYESQFPQHYFGYQYGANLAAIFKDLLGEKRTVLDFGCGPGFVIENLLSEGFVVAGMDSSRAVAKANERVGSCNFSAPSRRRYRKDRP